MSASRLFVAATSWAVMTVLPAVAASQTARFDLPIRVGQTVRITTDDGAKTQGKVLTLTPASVVIGDGGAKRSSLAAADVRRIQIPDSVTNGVVIGAVSVGLIGGLAAGYGAGVADLYDSGFFSTEPDEGLGGGAAFLVSAVVGAAVGALLGRAIDASRVKTIYDRPAGSVVVSLRPNISNASRGVGVRVTW